MSTTNNPNIDTFFIKLHIYFPKTININKSEEFENVKHTYITGDFSKWFAKYENNNREVFLFGKIKKNSIQPPLLTLTFDKISSYSKNCSGIINAKNIYINVEYFIENYPNFRTKLNETIMDIFINGHSNSINVIKLGNYVDNINSLINNLDILLNELDEFNTLEKPKMEEIIENSRKCEICGKKLKKDKDKLCKKCLKKRHAYNILVNLLKYVEPQTPFEKNDLKIIYKEEIEIDDCIWSLEEFNLLTQNNNQYCLANNEKLNKFIAKYGTINNTPIQKEKKEEPKKINKKCSICKKILPVSKFYKSKKTEDGLEDYCKTCKKYVNTANYLKEILNQLSPGSKFKKNDLKFNFKNPLELDGRLWELQSFDLLIFDSNNDIYTLADLKTCQNFLDTYYIRGSITIKPEIKKENNIEGLTEEEQMNSVIKSIKNGKTDKEAAKIAGINLYRITHWFNEGKNNSNEKYIDFYNRYIEAKNEAKINSYKNFYVIESFNIKEDLTIADTLRKKQMEKVLKEIGLGSSLKIAAFNSGINYETLQYWYKRGKQNFGAEYNEFYDKINILQSPIEVPKPDNEFKNENSYNIEEINNELNIPEVYKHILYPLPYKFKQIFKGAKESKSGFAWVKKHGNSWRYDRTINENRLHLSMPNIYDLYCEVKKHGYVWGVRNLEKAKKTLKQSEIPKNNDNAAEEIYNELNIPELYNNILDPLPYNLKKLFHGSKESESGFAWVKKSRNSWRYERQQKNEYQSISNHNIYDLFNDVKKHGYIWGVRNLEKAKETLKQSKIPTIQTSKIEEEYPFEHILDPISNEYLKRFRKPSSSGIAWVNKINNTWAYNNPKDGLYFYDSNIYNLYLKIKKEKLPWGVRDLEKAKETLALCEKPKFISKIPEKIEEYSPNITCTYLTNDKIIKTIVNGEIKDNEVIKVINNFQEFEEQLIRIITTRHSTFTELFIEFNLGKSELTKFNEIINKFNYKNINEIKEDNKVNDNINEIKEVDGVNTNQNTVMDIYNEKYLLKDKSEKTIMLYIVLKNKILSEFNNIELNGYKLYWVFKTTYEHLATVIPFNKYLKTYINSDNLNDYKNKTKKVSKNNHLGVGQYEFRIKSLEDLTYFLELFKQTYEEKMS